MNQKCLLIFIILIMPINLNAQQHIRAFSHIESKNAEIEKLPNSLNYEVLREKGFYALYNLDYQLAKQCFTKIIDIDPYNPAGYLYTANSLWIERLSKTKKLQTTIYNEDSFYSNDIEAIDPTFDKEFRLLLSKAIKCAEKKIKNDKNNVITLYELGVAYGTLAGYEATVTRSFISALKNGSKAVELHKKVLSLNPNFIDANLTLGVHNYVVGALPLPVKIMAAIGGITGSKTKGIELLQQVSKMGKYANDDALVMLVALYRREKQFANALEAIQTLSKKYPSNYLIKMELADLFARNGKIEESINTFSEVLSSTEAYNAKDLIEYQYGETLFAQKYYEEALKHFLNIQKLKDPTPDLTTLAILRVGQINDINNQREQATLQYKRILTRKNTFNSHNLARQYLKQPYTEN